MKTINAVFIGGKQAGCIGLLTLFAARYQPLAVVAYDDAIGGLAESLGLKVESSVKEPCFQQALSDAEILVSVHGREIVPDSILDSVSLGGINVHPCLYAYKGSDPVERLLADGNSKASVGVHRMTAKLDQGEVLVEEFVQVDGLNTVPEVYNALYPHYASALHKALGIMRGRLVV